MLFKNTIGIMLFMLKIFFVLNNLIQFYMFSFILLILKVHLKKKNSSQKCISNFLQSSLKLYDIKYYYFKFSYKSLFKLKLIKIMKKKLLVIENKFQKKFNSFSSNKKFCSKKKNKILSS